MITYDDVWTSFLQNYKTDDIDVPQEEDVIYGYIHNAILLFNNRMRTNAQCDDASEVISGVCSNDEKLIIAQYLRLIFLEHTKDFYEKLLQGFEGDVGFKGFTAQLVSVKQSVKDQKNKIDEFIFNTRETFL